MKKLLLAIILCAGFAASAFAQSNPPLRLQEIDGSPNVLSPTTIKVTNGTLSCSGKVCTITISGGGGGSPGGSNTQLQYNNAGVFGGISTLTSDGTIVTFSPTVTTGTGATSGLNATANSLTTGTAFHFSSSSVTSGSIVNIASTSTAGATGVEGLNIAMSGANGTTAQTVTGATIAVTNTNATSGTNIGLQSTASGATTQNLAGVFVGDVAIGGTSSTFGGFTARGALGQIETKVMGGGVVARAFMWTGGMVATSASFGTYTGQIYIEPGSRVGIASGHRFSWVSSATDAVSGTEDTAWVRNAAAVIRATNASTGAGSLILGTSAGAIGTSGAGVLAFTLSTTPTTSPTDTVQLYSRDAAAGDAQLIIRNEAGNLARVTGTVARNAARFDKTNTTLADVTGLSFNVEAGVTYSFTSRLFLDADAVGGGKFAIAGTATATAITYQINEVCNATNALTITARQTALAGASGQAGCTAGYTEINGTITVNAAGTLTTQFAQNVAAGTSSILVGSWMKLDQN